MSDTSYFSPIFRILSIFILFWLNIIFYGVKWLKDTKVSKKSDIIYYIIGCICLLFLSFLLTLLVIDTWVIIENPINFIFILLLWLEVSLGINIIYEDFKNKKILKAVWWLAIYIISIFLFFILCWNFIKEAHLSLENKIEKQKYAEEEKNLFQRYWDISKKTNILQFIEVCRDKKEWDVCQYDDHLGKKHSWKCKEQGCQ